MSCEIREELLALSLSGDLEADQRAAVSAHVKECDICRNVMAELQLSQQRLTNTFAEPAEEDLRSVRIAIKGRVAPHFGRRLWFSVAALAVGLAIFLSPVLFRRNTEDRVHRVATAQRNDILPEPRLEQKIPNLKSPEQVHRRVHRAVTEAGLRNVMLTTNASGKSELRMVTADPDVLILMQMDDNTHAN
jgi:hypothetical protein